jgi:hypothetical protein
MVQRSRWLVNDTTGGWHGGFMRELRESGKHRTEVTEGEIEVGEISTLWIAWLAAGISH